MIVLVLALAAAGPCEGVFDRTQECSSPASLAVLVKDPVIAAAEPASDEDARVVGGRFLAASGVAFVLSTTAASLAVWTGGHIDGLSDNGNLDGKTLTTLRDQQRFTVVASTVGYLATVVLAGTGFSLFVFDPAEGGVRTPFEVLE